MAQQHLRNLRAYLDVPTLGQPEASVQAKEALFDAEAGIDAESRAFVQGWMKASVEWVRAHTG